MTGRHRHCARPEDARPAMSGPPDELGASTPSIWPMGPGRSLPRSISSGSWCARQELDPENADRRNALMTGQPLRILIIGAHPDDADIKAGGTAAKWCAL